MVADSYNLIAKKYIHLLKNKEYNQNSLFKLHRLYTPIILWMFLNKNKLY